MNYQVRPSKFLMYRFLKLVLGRPVLTISKNHFNISQVTFNWKLDTCTGAPLLGSWANVRYVRKSVGVRPITARAGLRAVTMILRF